jgi:hypothetical protein
LKSMKPPGSRVLGHYGKSPVSDCGPNRLPTRAVQWTVFRGAADCRFARESGQRNRLDRPVVAHR